MYHDALVEIFDILNEIPDDCQQIMSISGRRMVQMLLALLEAWNKKRTILEKLLFVTVMNKWENFFIRWYDHLQEELVSTS